MLTKPAPTLFSHTENFPSRLDSSSQIRWAESCLSATCRGGVLNTRRSPLNSKKRSWLPPTQLGNGLNVTDNFVALNFIQPAICNITLSCYGLLLLGGCDHVKSSKIGAISLHDLRGHISVSRVHKIANCILTVWVDGLTLTIPQFKGYQPPSSSKLILCHSLSFFE